MSLIFIGGKTKHCRPVLILKKKNIVLLFVVLQPFIANNINLEAVHTATRNIQRCWISLLLPCVAKVLCYCYCIFMCMIIKNNYQFDAAVAYVLFHELIIIQLKFISITTHGFRVQCIVKRLYSWCVISFSCFLPWNSSFWPNCNEEHVNKVSNIISEVCLSHWTKDCNQH